MKKGFIIIAVVLSFLLYGSSAWAALGTFNTGAAPVSLAFDGANIWVANHDNSTVTKLRASDGTLLGTFNTGAAPVSLAFDGANIWVANHDDSTVTKY